MNRENRMMPSGTVPVWTTPDRLRKAREQSGLDQSEFADAIGVSRGTVSNYERGSSVYRRPVQLAWAMCSGVPLEWLLTGQQSAPHPSESDEGQAVRREGLEPPTRWFGAAYEVATWTWGGSPDNVIPLRKTHHDLGATA
jgi:transcriptional regulator with XRE-family HTH domain